MRQLKLLLEKDSTGKFDVSIVSSSIARRRGIPAITIDSSLPVERSSQDALSLKQPEVKIHREKCTP